VRVERAAQQPRRHEARPRHEPIGPIEVAYALVTLLTLAALIRAILIENTPVTMIVSALLVILILNELAPRCLPPLRRLTLALIAMSAAEDGASGSGCRTGTVVAHQPADEPTWTFWLAQHT
jgi:hypothetical protein